MTFEFRLRISSSINIDMSMSSSIIATIGISVRRSIRIQCSINCSIMISTNFQTCININTNLNNRSIRVGFRISILLNDWLVNACRNFFSTFVPANCDLLGLRYSPSSSLRSLVRVSGACILGTWCF